jgi:hypothetical protein
MFNRAGQITASCRTPSSSAIRTIGDAPRFPLINRPCVIERSRPGASRPTPPKPSDNTLIQHKTEVFLPDTQAPTSPGNRQEEPPS